MNEFLDQNIVEVTNTNILSVHPKDTVKKAKEILDASNRNLLPVLVSNQFVGVVFKKGFQSIRKVQFLMDRNYDVSFDLDKISIDQYVDTSVKSLGVSAKIKDALEFFIEHRQYYIPILDGKNFVGLVTPFDVFQFILKSQRR